MERIAIYPGSFDPVTNGHLDIVERGLKIFDKIVVTILHNPAKTTLFNVSERLDMLRTSALRNSRMRKLTALTGCWWIMWFSAMHMLFCGECGQCLILNLNFRWR